MESTGDSNEHGNDSKLTGSEDSTTSPAIRWGTTTRSKPALSLKDRDAYQRLISRLRQRQLSFEPGAHIRDAYVHTLSHLAELHLDERTNESCIVYLNGQYWGVYEYREKVDDLDFTEEYYDQPRHFVDFIKTWGDLGGIRPETTGWIWSHLHESGHDGCANYDYVSSQLNPLSLIDYFILNSYIVSADWLDWNTAWWREASRWRCQTMEVPCGTWMRVWPLHQLHWCS